MPLPKLTVISVSDLQSIADGHPVYRIRIGTMDYSLKAEVMGGPNASSDVKWASKIMHNVADNKSNDTKIRMLEEREVDALAMCYTNFNLSGPEQIKLEETLTTPNAVWYLMNWQPSLLHGKDNMSNAEIDQLFAIVNHGAFWKKLGKIIAVDLFTGNGDRFDFGYYAQATPQNFWSNKGNLFLNVANINRAVPIGLDFMFTANSFGIDGVLDQGFITAMKSKTEIGKIASLIIDSIMDALTGKTLGAKTSLTSRFKSAVSNKRKGHSTTADKYHDYLTNSIWDGLDEIKKFMISKKNQYAQVVSQPGTAPNPVNQRFVPNLPNHNPHRPGATVPIAHNNLPVAKKVFPANIEQRMRRLQWIS